MKIGLTLSANAGMAITVGNRCLWVDALHNQKVDGFSTVTNELFQKMVNGTDFPAPDVICYTHCHWDHFSAQMTEIVGYIYPNVPVLLPEMKLKDQILLTGDVFTYPLGELTLEFHRLTHEGEQYRNVPHYGIFITAGEKHILIAGDSAVAGEELHKMKAGRNVDLAILPFPWFTLRKGKGFLQEKLAPKAAVACHIPFAEDDTSGYRSATEKAVDACNFCKVYLLNAALQHIELEI